MCRSGSWIADQSQLSLCQSRCESQLHRLLVPVGVPVPGDAKIRAPPKYSVPERLLASQGPRFSLPRGYNWGIRTGESPHCKLRLAVLIAGSVGVSRVKIMNRAHNHIDPDGISPDGISLDDISSDSINLSGIISDNISSDSVSSDSIDLDDIDPNELDLDNFELDDLDLARARPTPTKPESTGTVVSLLGKYRSGQRRFTTKTRVGSILQTTAPNFSGIDFQGANLKWIVLTGGNLSCTNLSQAQLGRAELNYTIMVEANLSQADLSYANLCRANLTRACLAGADLSCAILIDADLTDADLRGARLTGADFTGAIVDGALFDAGFEQDNRA
jgi:uncharacterized protein YjbI with pentapeptide repeats